MILKSTLYGTDEYFELLQKKRYTNDYYYYYYNLSYLHFGSDVTSHKNSTCSVFEVQECLHDTCACMSLGARDQLNAKDTQTQTWKRCFFHLMLLPKC